MRARDAERKRQAAEQARQAALALEAERARRLAEQANMEGGPSQSGGNPGLPTCDSGAIGACYDQLTGNVLT